MSTPETPKTERRIVYNGDGGNAFVEFWQNRTVSPEEMKDIVEDSIDEMADAGVDTLSTVVWYNFHASAWPVSNPADDMSDITHPRHTDTYFPLYEAGYHPVQIMIDRCHQHGVEFVACFRMNDRHEHGSAALSWNTPNGS